MPNVNTRDRVSEVLWWMLMILGVLLTIVAWVRWIY
jgi:hypothetical protein